MTNQPIDHDIHRHITGEKLDDRGYLHIRKTTRLDEGEVLQGWVHIQGKPVHGDPFLDTNADGTEVEERPVSVQDLYATLYSRLGIDPTKKYISSTGRPIAILEGGTPVKELL